MLDLPCEVEAQLVSEYDLIERFLEQLVLVARVPGSRKLQLIKDAKPHGEALNQPSNLRHSYIFDSIFVKISTAASLASLALTGHDCVSRNSKGHS